MALHGRETSLVSSWSIPMIVYGLAIDEGPLLTLRRGWEESAAVERPCCPARLEFGTGRGKCPGRGVLLGPHSEREMSHFK